MKTFNLLLDQQKNASQKKKELGWLLSAALLTALLLHATPYYLLSNNLRKHNAAISAITVNKNDVSLIKSSSPQNIFSSFNEEEWLKKRNTIFNSLLKLSLSSHHFICFTSIQAKNNALIFTGNSASASLLTHALLHQRNMRQFNQIRIDTIETDRNNHLTHFQLTCHQ